MTEREQFEKWWDADEDDSPAEIFFGDDEQQMAWIGWSAALKNSKEEQYRQAILESWEGMNRCEDTICNFCGACDYMAKLVHLPNCIYLAAKSGEEK